MRFLLFYSYFALFGVGALGSMLAGPYQTVYFWYLYQMDVDFSGAANTMIAAGCVGSGPSKSCTFNEFLKHTCMSKTWNGKTSIDSNDLTPSVDTAAEALQRSEYNYAIYQHTMMPSRFGPETAAQPKPFSELLKALGDRLNTIRAKTPDSVLGAKLSNAKTALALTQEARQAENVQPMINGINAVLKERGATFEVYYEAKTSSNGKFIYKVIDVAKTRETCHGCDDELERVIADYVEGNGFPKGGKTSKAESHFLAAQAVQAEQSRMSRPAACS